MEQFEINRIRTQLINRRDRLNRAAVDQKTGIHYLTLLKEVDAALERIDSGTYGICEVCHDPIEEDRLIVNPLLCFCIDHLSDQQKRSLEEDLDLAQKIQKTMLPARNLETEGWDFNYHYEPAGAVSGDYCDVISEGPNTYFILGDVSGKGIAASMLMSQMHALFHSLIPLNLGINRLVGQINRLMCESNPSSHYATLLCIKAELSGRIEVCNAGHLPALLIKKNEQLKLDSTGIPVGLFCDADYSVNSLSVEKGDTFLLYTDGLTETFFDEEEYGVSRLSKVFFDNHKLSSRELTKVILSDVNKFIAGKSKKDDMTIMTVKKL